VAAAATVASVVLAIGVILGRVIDGRSVKEDVFGEFVALQQNLIAPVGIACRRRIQNSQDKRANDLYPMFYTLQTYAWSMAIVAASTSEGGVAMRWRRRRWSTPAAGQPPRPRLLRWWRKPVLLQGEG
jgi:hypothetical protein